MLYIENPELDWFEPDTIPSSLVSSREFSKGNRSLEFLELLACIKIFFGYAVSEYWRAVNSACLRLHNHFESLVSALEPPKPQRV